MTRSLFVSLLVVGAGWALGHGEFISADPAPDTVLGDPPSQVTLVFSEPVEVRFSTFKVYRLEDPGEAQEAAHETEHAEGSSGHHEGEHDGGEHGGDPEWLRLNGLAGALVSEALGLEEDGEARVDLGVNERGQSSIVTLALRATLREGVYVVMWNALSVDTHITQGYYVFRLEVE